ncbi:MAG: phosphoribosyltransferase family protein [Thaumarchaeota archaeon]|nr:phosphoribosyltransferase family protein [Nitrososphaerota archaeon]
MNVIFKDRLDAGKKLAKALGLFKDVDGIVLGIPRGGIVVASEIANFLQFRLDIVIPRKLGAPDQPELAIGAISEDGTVLMNFDVIRRVGATEAYIKEESARQLTEIARRASAYRVGRPAIPLQDEDIILVDDGVATGATLKAAINYVKNQNPRNLTVAIPVSPIQTIRELRAEADVICLSSPEIFYAIGAFYSDFKQITDEEVIMHLQKKR